MERIDENGMITAPVGATPKMHPPHSGRQFLTYSYGCEIYTERSVDSLIAELKALKENNPEFSDMYLVSIDDSSYMLVKGRRKALPLEIDWQQKNDAQRAEEKLERDRKEFERLREQFE